jgi:hypothetical protein
MSQWSEVPVTRRVWAGMALWGAAGLSLLPASLLGCKRKEVPPTCYAPPPPDSKSVTTGINAKPVVDEGALARWAELGRIWRELSAHAHGKYEGPDGGTKLQALGVEMNTALAALPAWTELRTLFQERAAHIYAERYLKASCYMTPPWTPQPPRSKVEEQMKAVDELREQGKLTKETAEKAAQVVAVQATYMAQLNEALVPDPRGNRDKLTALWESYEGGKLEAGEEAVRAGRHVVEFEAEQPGLLTEEAGR